MTIFIAGAGIVLLALFAIRKNAKEEQKKQREFLRKNWGKPLSDTGYSPERLACIRSFYEGERKHLSAEEQVEIDEITWKDLSMDAVYQLLNHACSTPGEEYLYFLLRTPCIAREPLERRQRLIAFFSENEDIRFALLEALMAPGKMKSGSFYGNLGKISSFPFQSSGLHILQGAGFVASLLFAAFGLFYGSAAGLSLPVCLLPLVVFMFWNVFGYYKRKAQVDSYYQVAAYVVRLLQSTRRLEVLQKKLSLKEEGEKELSRILTQISDCTEALKSFRKRAKYVLSGRGMSGGPADILLDYVRLFTHMDLIQFNSMMQLLTGQMDVVQELYQSIGYLDAMLCVASFRACFPEHALPSFTGTSFGVEAPFCVEDMYHPLMEHPVKNSIKAARGVLLTGSNASGKSTFLKTLAINVIFAQTIYTTLCSSYQSCFFRPMTSMALKDDLDAGESYFIVEIKSLKRILDRVDAAVPTLCIVDEVLRGTNTLERIAASSQILASLSGKNVFCLAATHDLELSRILKKLYDNFHFSEAEDVSGTVLFDYKLKKGAVSSKNAIRLLSVLGYSKEITDGALAEAEGFLKDGAWNVLEGKE